MPEVQTSVRSELLAPTAKIVSAYLSNNAVAAGEVPHLLEAVFEALHGVLLDERPASAALVPAVPIKRSVTDDYIVCLEDGRKLKLLKRHLITAYGLTPEAYRLKWGLKPDYPMVAPNYALKRKELAIQIGLGRKPEPTPKPKRKRATAAA